MLFESIKLPILSVFYSIVLLSMLFLRGIPFHTKKLSFSQIRRPKFLTEVFTVWIMGEYAEVLSSMAYYVLRDISALAEDYIHKLFGIALLTAFFCAILSPILMEKLGIKNFGALTILIRYPKEEYIHRFMFFYFASHLGGIFLF